MHMLELPILRRGPSYVVVGKPPGLLSVPGKGDEPHKKDCVASRVAAMIPEATGPLMVHRLDMDTSGLLVLGLNPDAQRALSKQFEERRVEKRYTALLAGAVDHAEQGEISLPIRLDLLHRPYQIVDGLLGRDAVTRWRILAHEVDRTRVEFSPITGRAHQLRVHAATPIACGGLGRCILGDVLYGSGYRAPDPPEARGCLAPAPRLMLHATFLAFEDPDAGQRIEAHSPAPF
jgi:tRNA pseudouridine32 synthase/23S rRNA pseudouridine746 synthase